MRRHGIAMAVAAAVTLALAPAASDARPRPRPVPRVVVTPPPMVYLVPGFADVYFYRSGATDVFFAAGMWWTAVGGYWYQAAHWQGPWMMVAPRYVPAALVRLPPRWHKDWYRWDRVPWRRVEAHRHAWHDGRRPAMRDDRTHRAPPRVERQAPRGSGRHDARPERGGHGKGHGKKVAQRGPAPRR